MSQSITLNVLCAWIGVPGIDPGAEDGNYFRLVNQHEEYIALDLSGESFLTEYEDEAEVFFGGEDEQLKAASRFNPAFGGGLSVELVRKVGYLWVKIEKEEE
jgi:hypothetical protein